MGLINKDKTNWFKPRGGGSDKRQAKDTPKEMKESMERWTGKGGRERKEGPDTRQEGSTAGNPKEGGKDKKGTVVVETLVFVPYTHGSKLQKKLHVRKI